MPPGPAHDKGFVSFMLCLHPLGALRDPCFFSQECLLNAEVIRSRQTCLGEKLDLLLYWAEAASICYAYHYRDADLDDASIELLKANRVIVAGVVDGAGTVPKDCSAYLDPREVSEHIL